MKDPTSPRGLRHGVTTTDAQLTMWPLAARETTPSQPPSRPRVDPPPRDTPAAEHGAPPRAIWDGAKQAFDVGLLKQVMLTRGFTAETLQLAAGVGHGTMYNVLAGRRVRISTARQILEILAATPPRFLLSGLAGDAV